MAFGSPYRFQASGDYYSPPSPLRPKLDTVSRPRPSIFQPPRSPVSPATPSYASSSALTPSFNECRLAGLDDGHFEGSRKRARPDEATPSYYSHSATTPHSAAANGWSCVPAEQSKMPESRDGLISPAPFVNARYLLAGGLDTPGLVQAAQYEDSPAYADESFRTKWNTASDYSDSFNFDVMQGPLARERNGRRKLPLSPNGAGNETSWGKLVLATTLTLVGGVAHRAWNFVSATAPFLGFHAGGGQGYFLPPAQAAPEDPPLFQQHQEFDNIYQNATPTPSSYFPFSTSTEDFLGDFEQDNPATPPSSRPAKRQQTDTGWVMVSGEYERDNSPARLSTRKSAIPRPAPPQQQRPQLASRAGSRRSLLPVSRRGSSNTSIGAGSPYSSTALARPHSSQLRHAASFAPTRSPARPPTTTTQIPSLASPALTPEQRLLRQQQRGEKEADASMRKMNKRLRGLIREGKEALGASIEVGGNEWGKEESEVEDEGFFEGAGGGVWRREKSDW